MTISFISSVDHATNSVTLSDVSIIDDSLMKLRDREFDNLTPSTVAIAQGIKIIFKHVISFLCKSSEYFLSFIQY